MTVLDYSRSFVTFVLPENNARIGVEASCLLTWPDGRCEQFLMFASCKSEDTYAAANLFKTPNYDFSGIFGETRYCINRIYADSMTEKLETGLTAERFAGLVRHLHPAASQPLPDKAAIVEATLKHRPIVARTEIVDEATGLTTLIEYPVKTMNVHRGKCAFQVDTGPLPLYDFTDPTNEIMARFRWAYVAYNDFHSAYFVCQAPTPILRDGAAVASTSHYSHIFYTPQATHGLFAIEE